MDVPMVDNIAIVVHIGTRTGIVPLFESNQFAIPLYSDVNFVIHV